MEELSSLPVLAISGGDPAGVGPEVAVRAAMNPDVRSRADVFLVAHGQNLAAVAQRIGVAVDVAEFDATAEPLPRHGLAVHRPVPDYEETRPGELSAAAGRMAMACFEEATRLTRDGFADALVTAPVHKGNLRAAAASYLDHTGGLAQMLALSDPRTMFETGNMRIFFATRHLSLRRAIDALWEMDLVDFARRVHEDLRRLLGIDHPRLALAALNPHAGDGGLFGREEIDLLGPAVARAGRFGLDIRGPIPADAVFHRAAEGDFDAVISLYHDQGHVAAKTRDFFGTVSYTLGLPFLRTSPDHGSAMDIAGQGIANPRSMILACLRAATSARRWLYQCEGPNESGEREDESCKSEE
ncbi:MAG: 4-hydroxythreonine-4-phosphate dehydrogenase PdxA [Clostridia bacterium]